MNWQDNIIESRNQIRELLGNTKTIAVVGIKTEEQSIVNILLTPCGSAYFKTIMNEGAN